MASLSAHKICSFAVRFITVCLVLLLLAGSIVQAARPAVALRGAMVYPRSDLTTAEALVWRTQLTVRHQISDRLGWYLLGDFNAATLTRPSGLRLYSGYVQLRLSPAWRVSLGRHVQWNSIHTTRFDGITLDRRKGARGRNRRISLYAGMIPHSEFRNDYGEAESAVAGLVWQRTVNSSSYSLQAWGEDIGGDARVYVGGSLRHRFGSRITLLSDLAADALKPALDKLRLRTRIRITSRISAFVQYRLAGRLTVTPYSWMADTSFAPRQTLSAGVEVMPMKRMQLRMSLVQRLGENQGKYLQAQVSWGGLQLAWQSHAQTLYGGQYLSLSGQHTLLGKTKMGGSVGTGTYTLFDEQSPAAEDLDVDKRSQSTLSATFWVQGYLGRHLSWRLFTQYTKNRYFTQDGRIGLQVSYAL